MKPATIRKIFLLGTVSLALLFTSCENFLKAQDTANQIKDAIEIANSNPTTIYIEAEKDSGTVTPAQVRVKKHETFEMKFSPSDNWKFIGWEVLDRTTMEPVADAIKFDDATKLEVKASFVKPAENLVIRPKCLLLPAITSSTPGAAQASYANTPIKITFNMPMEDESVTAEDSLFKYGPQNIYISYGSVYIAEYFEEPRFNSDKTVLTLTPKASALQSFIATENKPFIDVQVSFGGKIIVKNGENELSMANTAQEITARYRKDTESTPPEKYAFYAAADSDYSTHFTQAALSTFTNTEILQNRANGKIYIYGRYYDADSGVNTITLTEKHTNARDGSLAPVTQDPVYFTAANANFTDDGNGTTTFCIEYDLKSDDGAILISITVSDGCDISAPEETFTVIKDSVLDLSGVELWNFKPGEAFINDFTDDGTETGNPIQYDNWPDIVKNIKLDAIHKQLYKDYYVPETELHEVSITYNSTPHNMIFDSTSNIWSFNINDISDISKIELTLTIEDDSGHRATKEFSFPDIPTFINVEQVGMSSRYNAYFSTQAKMTRIIGVFDQTSSGTTKRQYRKGDENSLSGLMYAGDSESQYSSFKFFFINGYLAGYFTQAISVTDSKAVDSSLPAVRVKNATVLPNDDGDFLIYKVTIDDTNGNPWNTYSAIMAQTAINGAADATFFFTKDAMYDEFSLAYEQRRYDSPLGIKLIGITSENISPNSTYDHNDMPPEWYSLCYPSTNPAVYEKIKPTFSATDTGYRSISAIYESGKQTYSPLLIPKCYDYMIPAIAQDRQSGIKKIVVNSNGNIWTYNENEFITSEDFAWKWEEGEVYGISLSSIPPIWDADKEINTLSVKFYDAYDNCLEWNGYYTHSAIPSFSLKTETTNTLVSEEYENSLYNWRLGIVKLVVSNSTTGACTWSKHKDIDSVPTVSNGSNGGKVFTYSNVSLPTTDSFVKVIATASLEDDLRSTNFGHSVPYYFYTGSTKNSGNYDYITPLGSSKTSVLVASDAPTFVHTLVTKYPLSECQDWSVERWEHNHKHIGDKYLSFPTITAQKYTIPVDQMDDGDCYVVIAHFADGTSAIGEVMQK